jgi:hypothetical protein
MNQSGRLTATTSSECQWLYSLAAGDVTHDSIDSTSAGRQRRENGSNAVAQSGRHIDPIAG